MAHTTARTWVFGELITTAMANEQWRDNDNAIWAYTANGDILYRSAATVLTPVAIGADQAIMYSNGTVPAWLALGARGGFGGQLVFANSAVVVADGVGYFGPMPSKLNGHAIINMICSVIHEPTAGTPAFQLARGRQANPTTAHDWQDVFSTKPTIDTNEFSSIDGAAPAVVDGTYDDIATGDFFRVDCDVAGTGTLGLSATIETVAP